jgi:hypothetical protein
MNILYFTYSYPDFLSVISSTLPNKPQNQPSHFLFYSAHPDVSPSLVGISAKIKEHRTILSRVGVTIKKGFGLDDWIYFT